MKLVKSRIKEQTGAKGDKTWGQMGIRMRHQMWNQIKEEVRKEVRTQVWNQIKEEVRKEVRTQVLKDINKLKMILISL